jgi:hypothetical protein
MNLTGMYLVGGIFNLVFFILSIIGYCSIARKTGNKFTFWWFFAVAWLLSLISYVLLITGTPSDAWYITTIRICTYIFFLATIISMFVELARLKK